MKTKNKTLLFVLLLVISILYFLTAINAPYKVYAYKSDRNLGYKGMVVLEANTNQILNSFNENLKLPMASLTKIITCICAIENSKNLDELVSVNDKACGVEGSSIYLKKGEKLTLRELLYGLMLASGNDAAMAIAYHISGSEIDFVNLMNKFVKKIGANNTSLKNPHGLDEDGHYTTAKDLALITSYALKNNNFLDIVSTKKITIRGNDEVEKRYLKHKNKLIFSDENCVGVKTGFTDNAGRCLVHSTISNDGMTLITVVLNCPDMFNEAKKLSDLALKNYKLCEFIKPYNFVGSVNIINGNFNVTNVATIKGFSKVVKISEKDKYSVEYDIPEYVEAPIKNGDVIGKVNVKFNGKIIYSDNLISIDNVNNTNIKFMIDNILNKWYA